MKFQTRQKHMIDLVFPIALFFVFAASSLAVLLLAANLYSSTTGQIQANDQNRTCLSYISEKIRQNDSGGAVSIRDIEGTECLSLRGNYNGVACTTYIYEYDGFLKELFLNDGVDILLKNGKTIMEINSLDMDKAGTGLFEFTSTDRNGDEDSLIISERSVP
ncbi:DUF4860 domain-containing protein [Dorea sp. D27]|uniref:DUF4860 domain-containing protein n=1 Tax=Dorea sp. D27 TaxID=658665 RepID=UPI000673AFDD|nr:DUF4860 domain-containing protein [Dorea sp. D27]KMZ54496.1 hypothetical protein HMPREF0980_01350 [Dorea sp. D27]